MNKKVKHIIISLSVIVGITILASSCMEGLLDTPIDGEMELIHTYSMPFVQGTYTLDKAPISIDTIWQGFADSLLPLIVGPVDSTVMYEFEVIDTMDASLSGAFDNINEATLFFTYINGFPFDCTFQAILYDSEGDVNVDTILSVPILASEVIDGVIQLEEGLDSVTMADDFYTNVDLADQIIVNSIYTAYINIFDVPDDLSNFSLWFHIGMKAEVSLK